MLKRIVAANGVVVYRSAVLEGVGVAHAFSTRVGGWGGAGGASPAPFDSFNLGNPNGCAVQDCRERIVRHEGVLMEVAGCGGRAFCRVHQVHGGSVAVAQRGHPFDGAVKADGVVTDDPGRAVSVRTADCVPVLLATGDGRVVAAVHAGWRGVIAGVVGEAVGVLRGVWDDAGIGGARPVSEQTGRGTGHQAPAAAIRVVAAVGPCIGMEAFEVGGEVVEAFERVFGEDGVGGAGWIVRRRRDGKGHVSLREAVRRQLVAAGVSAAEIDVSDRCTWRDRDEFFSHRRDGGVTGRMAAVVSVRG